MRRPSPEWLLAPVFVLPLVAAASIALWARHDYGVRMEPYRRDGAATAQRWIGSARDDGRVAWLAERLVEATPLPGTHEEGWVPFSTPQATGSIRIEGARGYADALRVTDDYPAGLTAEALARPSARISAEAGNPAGRSDDVDPATAAFVSVLETRDLAKLRAAPLPASTKLYLLRRVFDGGPPTDVAALTTLAAFQRLVGGRRGPLPAGIHSGDGVVALVPSPKRLVVLYPASAQVPPLGPFVLSEGEDGEVRFEWAGTAPPAADGVAWSGHLDAPLAGRWSFVLAHGDRWWESAAFKLWALPAIVLSLAFLLVPTALFVALRKRRRLDEARARFVNELAHDLRTPVTSLRLHAEMLSEGRVPAGQDSRYLAVLGRETARLSSLLANLLDLSRLERGAREFDRQTLDVAEIAGDAVRDLTVIHPKRAADVTCDVPAGLAVSADRTALARCLANLLDNAAKFTTPGTSIRVTAERADEGRVRIVVADDGPGVAAKDRARIFDLYERGADAATNGAPGTGLGLALVRELVQGMGGRVALLDTPRGAAFEVTLPEAAHG